MEKSTDATDANLLDAANGVLTALAPRLEPAQLTRAWDALIAVQLKPSDSYVVLGATQSARTAPALRLDLAQAKRAADALIAVLEKSTDTSVLQRRGPWASDTGARLEPAQAKRAWNAVIANRKKWSKLSITCPSGICLARC